jgi:hypothetical protein
MDSIFERQTMKDVECVLDYCREEEKRHYYESECPEDHIFLVLERLRVNLDKVERLALRIRNS